MSVRSWTAPGCATSPAVDASPADALQPEVVWLMIPPTRPSRLHRRADTFAFGSGEAWRPLRLVLDDDTLAPAESAELLAFDDYPEVELTQTAPEAAPRLEIQEPAEDFIPIHTIGNGVGVFWVWHAARLRARAREVAGLSDVSEKDAYRALVFAAAAEEADADGFVTNREFVRTDRVGQQTPVYTPAEAMALVGLALRLHGNKSIGADLADLRLNGSPYHFVLGRELTQAGWRLFSGCVATSHATKNDTAINLGQAALGRFQPQAKIPSTSRVGDELVFQFETLSCSSRQCSTLPPVAHLVYFGGEYEEAAGDAAPGRSSSPPPNPGWRHWWPTARREERC